jgi:hypothetical protein
MHLAHNTDLITSYTALVQEPVTTINITRSGSVTTILSHFEDCVLNWPKGKYKLVLASPKREWVGLTNAEIDYQAKKDDHGVYFALGALWAEAKLKEKNNGT